MSISDLNSAINPTKLNGKTQKHVAEIGADQAGTPKREQAGWYRVFRTANTINTAASGLISLYKRWDANSPQCCLLAVSASLTNVHYNVLTKSLVASAPFLTKLRYCASNANETYSYIDVYVPRGNVYWIGGYAMGGWEYLDEWEFDPSTTGLSITEFTLD